MTTNEKALNIDTIRYWLIVDPLLPWPNMSDWNVNWARAHMP